MSHYLTITECIIHILLGYHVGSDLGWSDLFWTRTLPSSAAGDWSPRIALFGDMGNVNAQSLGLLQRQTQAGMYDMIFHVGDFAYDMDTVSVVI